jgi:hypothetical protein
MGVLPMMLPLVAIAWIYVVLMAAVAEVMAPGGTVLGAFFTIVGWGLLPLALVLYIGGTGARRRARRRNEQAAVSGAAQPDGSGHAAGDAVAPVREEP